MAVTPTEPHDSRATDDEAEPPRRHPEGALRATVDLLAEGALALGFLGATVVTWVPAAERRAMLQTAALGAAIGTAYALAAVLAARRRGQEQPGVSGLELWSVSVPAGLRAAAGFAVAGLALLRWSGSPGPG